MAKHIHRLEEGISDSELMSAEIENDALVIRIPLDLIIFAQQNREDPITITDKAAMAEYVKENVLEFGANEMGYTSFEVLLDNHILDALESGENWLHGWWEGDE